MCVHLTGVVTPDDGRKWLWVVVIAVAATVLCALLFTFAVCLHKRKKYNKYEKAHHNGATNSESLSHWKLPKCTNVQSNVSVLLQCQFITRSLTTDLGECLCFANNIAV